MKSIVLAAGKGSRLNSDSHILPKVLRKANDVALIDYVLDNINFIRKENTTIVVGYKSELVKNHVNAEFKFVIQEEQLGTGHAVKVTEKDFENYSGPILVVYGDMPLFKKETYQKLIDTHIKSGNACTLLTAVAQNPPAYGRIIRNEHDLVLGIKEEKDCNKSELNIKELNVGVYVFESEKLFAYLNDLKDDNSQGEYYLTDVPKHMITKGERIEAVKLVESEEIYGVNTQEELIQVEGILKERGVK